MPVMTVLCGVPGSGKSTWARSHYPDAVVLSMGVMRRRRGVFAREFLPDLADAARDYLYEGCDVVIDGANVRSAHRELWLGVAAEFDAFRALRLFPCELRVAVARQIERPAGERVPADRLREYVELFEVARAVVRCEPWDSIEVVA